MKKYLLLFIIPLLTLFNANTIKAQSSIKDSTVFCSMLSITYSYQFSGGDLAQRYGDNSTIGPTFNIKTKKNWIFGVDFNYMFGNDVKIQNDIVKNLVTVDGAPITREGILGDIRMFERGFCTTAKVGKVIPVFGSNPNSGIMVMASAGYLQHSIRIEVDQNDVPSLMGDYARGYDRLSSGLALSGFIGYLYLSEHKLTNFFIGVEYTQGWTKSLRDFNFDTRSSDMSVKKDKLYGIKFGWVFPIYKRAPNKFYYK